MEYSINPQTATVDLHSNSVADELELKRLYQQMQFLPIPEMTSGMVNDEAAMKSIIPNLQRLYGADYSLKLLSAGEHEYKGDFRFKTIRFTVLRDGVAQNTMHFEQKMKQIRPIRLE